MAKTVLVDAGFLVALLGERDFHHHWAVEQARHYADTWTSCEAVLSEAFHLLGGQGLAALVNLLRRGRLIVDFSIAKNLESTLALMEKYRGVPMSFADACLVRITETLGEPLVLTTDSD